MRLRREPTGSSSNPAHPKTCAAPSSRCGRSARRRERTDLMALSLRAEPQPAPMRTVLLAHGDADGRAMYRAMLEGLSYAIEECEDGAEALGKAIIRKPDLIVVSTRLARIDGLAL